MTHIIGMMWNRNEGDILEEVIESALFHVDSLFIADDNSTDNSWEIIQSIAKRKKDRIEYIRNSREFPNDQGQRQSLLKEIRTRYNPHDIWVQIIESDMMLLETDIPTAIKNFAIDDLAVNWQVLNAVRLPGTWKEIDTYPKWKDKIVNLMPYAHRMESLLYTFRPLPKVDYYENKFNIYHPWPTGFHHYTCKSVEDSRKDRYSPLLAHYGFRGPTHFYKKYNPTRKLKWNKERRGGQGVWDISSIESIEKTVPFFNGGWNSKIHDMTRIGWKKSRSYRQWK